MKPAVLVLEDGSVFEGSSFGSSADASGEVVFNTGMTGYQEVLTDPSYEGQIVSMTSAHIGNYGTNPSDAESRKPWVRGFVVRDVPNHHSSWRATESLEEYLSLNSITGITEVDTRRLTRHIRSKGAMRATISTRTDEIDALIAETLRLPEMSGSDLVKSVTTAEPYEWPYESMISDTPRFRVAAVDFGIKRSILKLLSAHGCAVTVFPASASPDEIMSADPDGVFLSNGPGDPAAVGYGVETVRALMGRVPLFGICLGHQMLALAAGLTTYKLPFGHRGLNHPVMRLTDRAVEITTQNHGFAVSLDAFGEPPASTLEGFSGGWPSDGWECETGFGRITITHINLNDGTIEGLSLPAQRAFSVQYHPEAGPGPHDARYLFKEFTSMMSDSSVHA